MSAFHLAVITFCVVFTTMMTGFNHARLVRIEKMLNGNKKVGK